MGKFKGLAVFARQTNYDAGERFNREGHEFHSCGLELELIPASAAEEQHAGLIE